MSGPGVLMPLFKLFLFDWLAKSVAANCNRKGAVFFACVYRDPCLWQCLAKSWEWSELTNCLESELSSVLKV